MRDLLCIFIGLMWWPAWHLLKFILRVTRVAIYDTQNIARHSELKSEFSKLNWLWIIPRMFFWSWRRAAWDDLRGWRRLD